MIYSMFFSERCILGALFFSRVSTRALDQFVVLVFLLPAILVVDLLFSYRRTLRL